MSLGLCDSPDRYAARFFAFVAGPAAGCPCCSFFRGMVVGAVVATLVVAAVLSRVATLIITAVC